MAKYYLFAFILASLSMTNAQQNFLQVEIFPSQEEHAHGSTIVAYMRDNGPPPKRHQVSESKDNGLTWGPVRDSEIVNEGSGSDIVTLANGHWVLAYNDTEDGRYTLAVSLSEDEGKTWKYGRHIERDLNEAVDKRNKAAYPSIIQGKDGMIHVVYSYQKYNTLPYDDDTIKYIRFTEEWLKEGDQ